MNKDEIIIKLANEHNKIANVLDILINKLVEKNILSVDDITQIINGESSKKENKLESPEDEMKNFISELDED